MGKDNKIVSVSALDDSTETLLNGEGVDFDP